MTKLGLLGVAALILSSALAGPAMAKDVNAYSGKHQRHHVAYRQADRDLNGQAVQENGGRQSWNDNRSRDQGFWPADAAAGAVGGAIGTAGAIATAPFGATNAFASGDTGEAWDKAYPRGIDRNYVSRNGLACTPGTWFRGDDGRRHPCQ
jgi:hypothetical protein